MDKEKKDKVIGILKNGLEGPISVNGASYNSVMPALGLSDQDIANVLTYVYNSWGNPGGVVTVGDVKKVKKSSH